MGVRGNTNLKLPSYRSKSQRKPFPLPKKLKLPSLMGGNKNLKLRSITPIPHTANLIKPHTDQREAQQRSLEFWQWEGFSLTFG